MRERRGRGEGAVYERSDGQWCASVTIGYDDQGRRRRRVIYAPTKGEVLGKLGKLQVAAATGVLPNAGGLNLSQYLHRWLEDAARPSVRPRTYQLYKWLIDKHIAPRIGGVKLEKISPLHVYGLLSLMEQENCSARLRQMVFARLSRALKQAMRWGLIPRNVCDAVDKPKAPRKEFEVLDQVQVQKFFKAAKGRRLYALYVVAVTTGLRQGELLGLRWKDVNLISGTLAVRQILQENNETGKLSFAEPKSAKSRRCVDLPKIAVDALRKHRKKMFAEGHHASLVFCDTDGNPIRKSNLIRRSFKKILKHAKLPDIRFHDLRHTAATLLLAQGVHPKVVQERLGHSTVMLTLDTYSHVLPSLQKEATNKLNRLFASLRM